jgi:SAM-dependent methyltransferase
MISRKFVASRNQLNEDLIRRFSSFLGKGLIMGFGHGGLVEHFKNIFSELIIVEGSKYLHDACIEEFRTYQNISCFNSYFETFELPIKDRVDVILGNHVLEHVDDPVKVLGKTRGWLKETGCAIFSVPNAKSLHRRIGVEMKKLKTIYELNENDDLIGHQRIYDQKSLLRDVTSAGYEIVESGGYDLKLVSQKQMSDLSQDLIKAIFQVSRHCPPDICANLYVVCKLKL